MGYNNNHYLLCETAALDAIDEAHIVGGTKLWARSNIAGTQWLIEVEVSSAYYNNPAAKTHQEALEIVAGAEWTADELP